jgi:APA family basic amino acid/polyamine antiporter
VTPTLVKLQAAEGVDLSTLPHAAGYFNLVAVVAIALITLLLVVGIKESARFNIVVVVVKLSVVLMFILAGAYWLFGHPAEAADNWSPFIPPNQGKFGDFGISGILRAAGVIFFAYIGFDAVSTTAQEARNPQRDMPIGILGSLFICTILYILVSGILTGMVPYSSLNVPEPIAVGIEKTGITVMRDLVKIGAIAGLSSVMLVMLMGQPRVFYSMSRDGLLPLAFSKVHRRFRTPYITTILTGVVCAAFAGALPISILGELVSIGTLLAFVIVCGGVWYLRVKEPERPRPFRTPLVPLVPILGMAVCFAMMAGLPGDTWLRLLIWLAIGLCIYYFYGRHHSLLQQVGLQAVEREPARPTYTAPKSSVSSESTGRSRGGRGDAGTRRGGRRGGRRRGR